MKLDEEEEEEEGRVWVECLTAAFKELLSNINIFFFLFLQDFVCLIQTGGHVWEGSQSSRSLYIQRYVKER